MQGSAGESHIQTHRGLILLMAALRGVSSVPRLSQCPVSLPTQLGDAGGGSGHIHRPAAASAALAALLRVVRINSKNIFQLSLFHPRWPSALLVTPFPSQTASHSILLSAVKCPPASSQAPHIALTPEAKLRRGCCGPAPYGKQLFNCQRLCVQIFDAQCFPGNPHCRG